MRPLWVPVVPIVLALTPWTGHAGEADGPARFAVGFHELPPGLEVGQQFHGGIVVAVNEALRFVSVEASHPQELAARARDDDRVRYLEAAPRNPLARFVPNDPGYATQYGPDQVGAPFAWDETLGSTSVVLCTADTGVRHTHEDLVARYAGGYDYVNDDGDPWDDHGHGTHVTGIAAAGTHNGKGIAGLAQAALRHVKVLDATGFGSWDVVASGITGCVDAGAHIVSLSIGGDTGATSLLDAVNYAWMNGVLVVAATGNDGPCTDCVDFPARYANTVAVGCTTAIKTLCSFSNAGPEVDLVAPGDNIQSTWHTGDTAYAFSAGTSMSVPHVAGVAALLKSSDPALSAADLRTALEMEAEDLGVPGLDPAFGFGLVRADRALDAPQHYSGRLVAGTGGLAVPCSPDFCPPGYQGLSAVRFAILAAPGRGYTLATASPFGSADADVCWRDADGELAAPCATNLLAPDVGTVPSAAVQADVFLTLGVDATYTLTINP